MDLQALNSNPLVQAQLNLIPISQAPLMKGSWLFPELQIPVSNVRYRTIDLGQASALVLDTLRALDSKAKEIRTETAFAEIGMDEYMLKTVVDELKIREAASLGIQYVAEQLSVIRELMVLAKEYRQAAIATSPANYAADHKNVAYNFDGATLQQDFWDFSNVIAGSIGRPPNGVLFGRHAWRRIITNTTIIAYFTPNTGVKPIITPQMVAQYLGVDEIQVANGGYRDDAKVFHPFFDNVAVMTYSERTAPQLNNMSYGYTTYMTYNGIKFDTRQSDPQGVERLIEAGCAERYRLALTNADAGVLLIGT